MKLRRRIVEYLAAAGERPSLAIVEEMTRQGVWFARGRVYAALAELVAAGVLERRTEPGGPERGGLPRSFYRTRGAP